MLLLPCRSSLGVFCCWRLFLFCSSKSLTLALNEEDKQREQIKFNTEMLKLFGLAALTTSGGIITLYLQKDQWALTILGICFVTIIAIVAAAIFLDTKELLK
jgi:hypothetical protein